MSPSVQFCAIGCFEELLEKYKMGTPYIVEAAKNIIDKNFREQLYPKGVRFRQEAKGEA